MKKTLPLLTLALVSLTGCVNINNAAPEESASSSRSASPSSTVTSSTTAAPASSSKAPESPSSSSSETPVHAVPEKTQNASKTSFAGTTAKGNDISFYMLPAFDQDTMNGMMRSNWSVGLVGFTVLVLCYPATTHGNRSEHRFIQWFGTHMDVLQICGALSGRHDRVPEPTTRAKTG